MVTFQKYKTNSKSGAVAYRQASSKVSIVFPKSLFTGEAPESIEVGADGLTPATSVRRAAREASQAVKDAKAVLEAARAERKTALAAKIASMTPEQKAKRDQNIAKAKARAAKIRADKAATA